MFDLILGADRPDPVEEVCEITADETRQISALAEAISLLMQNCFFTVDVQAGLQLPIDNEDLKDEALVTVRLLMARMRSLCPLEESEDEDGEQS